MPTPKSTTKKKIRYKPMIAGRGGWCEWVQPIMKEYLMKCCDCGLVHEMQFKVVEVIKLNKNGTWQAKLLDTKKYRVSLRARRNKKYAQK